MDVSPASGMRNLPPGEREAARGSVPDRLATGQAVHADAPPTPIVDEALKRLAKSIKEHFIDPLDQFAVTVQFDRVKVEAALVLNSNPPLELRRDHREGDGRRRRDDVLGCAQNASVSAVMAANFSAITLGIRSDVTMVTAKWERRRILTD